MPRSPSRRRLRIESLEHRRVMATIAAGVQLFEDITTPAGISTVGAPIQGNLEANQTFWVAIVVQDRRAGMATTPGVTALPIDVDWDPSVLALAPSTTPDASTMAFGPVQNGTNSLLLTTRFPLSRSLLAFRPEAEVIPDDPVDQPSQPIPNLTQGQVDDFFNIGQLRGGVVPGLPGDGGPIGGTPPDPTPTSLGDLADNTFSLLRMTALTSTGGTLFSIRLAGSAAVADGDVIDGFDPLTGFRTREFVGTNVVELGLGNAVRAMFQIDAVVQPAALTGNVFVDTNFDGVFDVNEFGVPRVTVTVTGTTNGGTPVSLSDLTDADGQYAFSMQPGTYEITQTQPPGLTDASIAVGQVLPGGDTVGMAVGLNKIVGVQLAGGQSGVNYNFGERLTRITKRLFVANATPQLEICDAIEVRCGLMTGTRGDDVIVVNPVAGGAMAVSINGTATRVPAGLVEVLYIDGLGGSDTTNRGATARLNSDRSTLTELIGGIDIAIEMGADRSSSSGEEPPRSP